MTAMFCGEQGLSRCVWEIICHYGVIAGGCVTPFLTITTDIIGEKMI
jgi:hypothetical protein